MGLFIEECKPTVHNEIRSGMNDSEGNGGKQYDLNQEDFHTDYIRQEYLEGTRENSLNETNENDDGKDKNSDEIDLSQETFNADDIRKEYLEGTNETDNGENNDSGDEDKIDLSQETFNADDIREEYLNKDWKNNLE